MEDQRDQLGDRIRRAMMAYAAHQPTKRTSDPEYGAAVAESEGVATPFAIETVQAWLEGSLVPALSTLVAMADLAGYTSNEQIGRLVYGNDHAIHSLEENEFRQYFQGKRAAQE